MNPLSLTSLEFRYSPNGPFALFVFFLATRLVMYQDIPHVVFFVIVVMASQEMNFFVQGPLLYLRGLSAKPETPKNTPPFSYF